jgi:hypothetical protein
MTAVPAAFAPPILSLPVYTRRIPESAREWKTDPHSVTLRSVTVTAELDALASANAATTRRLEYEILQRCITKIDGAPVDQTVDLIDKCSPKVRVLLVDFLNAKMMPSNKERSDFEGSEEVEVP